MRKVVFLDRDGTINRDTGYVSDLNQFEFLPGAIEGLKILQKLGFELIVVTNQSAIGRGWTTWNKVRAINFYMRIELFDQGIDLSMILVCPHKPQDKCGCRKPLIGLAEKAADRMSEIDWENSWTIGNSSTDVEFGQKLGTKTVLLMNETRDAGLNPQPTFIAQNLKIAAQKIREIEGKS